ncbi:hypothetical protein BC940DRAFT_291693 [Gongronella butleri]|nr:hypothetical protein BC940DRAFT_291693 [Gongronella butleri]
MISPFLILVRLIQSGHSQMRPVISFFFLTWHARLRGATDVCTMTSPLLTLMQLIQCGHSQIRASDSFFFRLASCSCVVSVACA